MARASNGFEAYCHDCPSDVKAHPLGKTLRTGSEASCERSAADHAERFGHLTFLVDEDGNKILRCDGAALKSTKDKAHEKNTDELALELGKIALVMRAKAGSYKGSEEFDAATEALALAGELERLQNRMFDVPRFFRRHASKEAQS